jgi:hypothetical protein
MPEEPNHIATVTEEQKITEIFDEKERSVTGTSVKHEIGQQV